MVEFVNKDGFSTFELLSDSRKGTVAFDHGVGERSYSLEQMDEALPTVSKDGVVFKGWKINGHVVYNCERSTPGCAGSGRRTSCDGAGSSGKQQS